MYTRYGQVFLRRFHLSRISRITDKLTPLCLVDKESTSRAFPVNIAPTQTVGEFKKFIKKEQVPAFDDITANQLTLWLVSVPDDDGDSAVTLDALHEKRKLFPRTYVSNLFPNGPGEDTYIIVQRPPPGNLYYHVHCLSMLTTPILFYIYPCLFLPLIS
jgi:hypothetical protein